MKGRPMESSLGSRPEKARQGLFIKALSGRVFFLCGFLLHPHPIGIPEGVMGVASVEAS